MRKSLWILNLVLIALIILAPVVALASDVSGARYITTVTITNNSTAATNVAANFTLSTADMITQGMLNATATDAAMRDSSGNDVSFMPGWSTNPWITFAPTIGATSSINQYLYSNNATGGTLRYFPNATGGTVIDTASMEPSANYSFKWNGIRFSSQSANLTDKPSTFNIGYNPTTGNVTFTTTEVLTTYAEQDTGGFLAEVGDNVTYTAMTSQTDAYLYKIYTPGYFDALDIRWTQYVTGDAVNPYGWAVIGATNTLNDIVGLAATDLWAGIQSRTATDVDFRIGRGNFVSANSTGDLAYANRTVNLRLQRTAGSDTATYTMYNENMTQISSRTISGLGATTYRYIVIMNNNDGSAGRLITGSIANVRLNDPSFNVAVSNTADHDIEVTSNATSVGIRVDGGAWSTNATYTIPNTTSNWYFVSNAAYVNSINMSVGGNPRGAWGWEYAATFTDQTGNGNTMTPNFRTTSSDTDVSAVIVSQEPTEVSATPSSNATGGWVMAPTVPTAPGLFGGGVAAFPGKAEIDNLTTTNDPAMPVSAGEKFVAFASAILVFIAVFAFTHRASQGIRGSLLIPSMAATVVLIYWWRVNVLDGWELIPLGVAIAVLLMWRNPNTTPI